MRFADRTFLVTGGAMGIGAATVKRLAGEGARVFLADCNERAASKTMDEIRTSSEQVTFMYVDLSDAASIESMGERLADEIESLHGLVNNAGIFRGASVAATGDTDWEPQVAINLRAPALCAKALLPLLQKGPGHIVNLSSEGAFKPYANRWVYDATKAGICALTRNMACEFIEFGIRVNTVSPGWTVTEMHFGTGPDATQKKTMLENHRFDGAVINRLGRPEEIAAAIAFLLSDDASYITATTLHVDGGRVAL